MRSASLDQLQATMADLSHAFAELHVTQTDYLMLLESHRTMTPRIESRRDLLMSRRRRVVELVQEVHRLVEVLHAEG
jgi:hypothetical protein